MGQILAFLWAKGWFVFGPFFTLVFLLTTSPYGKLWENNTNRKRWIGDLYQNNWKARYRRTMGRILDRIDRTLSVHELIAQANSARIAFSHGLINLSTLLAIAYPVLGFVGQWIFGSPLQLGNTLIAPAGSATARVIVFFWFLALLFSYVFLFHRKTVFGLRTPISILKLLVLLGGSFFIFSVGNRVELPTDLAFAGIIALALVTVGIAGTISAIIIVIILILGLKGIIAFVVAVATALSFTEARFGFQPIFRMLYLILLLILLLVSVQQVPSLSTTESPSPTYLLLFFAIFPIFNALADFTSTGLTRYLLRRGLTKPIWFNALLDTLGGLSVFFLLGFALIGYIHLVRPQDGTPLLDLSTLFDQLQNNPSDFWWLALMLGSTLLPTLLHLMVGVATILIQYPAFLRNWTIRKLASGGEGSDIDGWQGSAMVCGMISLSIWLPVILFYYLFRMNHSAVINGTIWVFSSYADLIGAL
ncbi:hypothetical protein [Profundibacter amoris]|uniref:Uncharacterized protein n=1 Tax=Profundibacter amoris TaxID=2171755 RepID=A0A347UDR8_9RHOB|nr:hypothetical protein [Profundibacter amoris]AXX96996.1 hypothetical protein BAR1_03055 [Profundibacter amoris]